MAKGQQQRLDDARRELARGPGRATPQWYVNGQGQAFVVIPGPAEVLMGSPAREPGRYANETQHRVRIERAFAVGAKPVTLAQFQVFRKNHPYDKQLAPTGDCPVHNVTWYEAAAYCNWLSKEEHLPPEEWCYIPNKDGEYGHGMKLAPDYLRRTGYRLPNEAEWEYACRAGTVTSRFYGNSEDLLEKYAWYQKDSGRRTWPVGSLKPNEWGLFDIQGNVFTWCQERYKDHAAAADGRATPDAGDDPDVLESQLRVVRGGSYADAPDELRAARRIQVNPGIRSNYAGLRVARTLR